MLFTIAQGGLGSNYTECEISLSLLLIVTALWCLEEGLIKINSYHQFSRVCLIMITHRHPSVLRTDVSINPLISVSDQDRSSPYNTNTIPS